MQPSHFSGSVAVPRSEVLRSLTCYLAGMAPGASYTHTHTHTHTEMGSDESHFYASLIVSDKVTRQCPQTATFEKKGELKRIRTEVPLLTSLTLYR